MKCTYDSTQQDDYDERQQCSFGRLKQQTWPLILALQVVAATIPQPVYAANEFAAKTDVREEVQQLHHFVVANLPVSGDVRHLLRYYEHEN